MVGCRIEHIAEADHPAAGKLIIATELAAASKAATTPRSFTPKRSLQSEAAPSPANVGADVASGPGHRRWRRRYVGRRLPRKVSCRCLTCSQTNCDSKQCQRRFSHDSIPLTISCTSAVRTTHGTILNPRASTRLHKIKSSAQLRAVLCRKCNKARIILPKIHIESRHNKITTQNRHTIATLESAVGRSTWVPPAALGLTVSGHDEMSVSCPLYVRRRS